MDELSRKELDRILMLHESELTVVDIAFLCARRSYLTKSQRRDYAEFLPVETETEAAQAQVAPKVNPFKQAVQQVVNVVTQKPNVPSEDRDVRVALDTPLAPQAPVQQPAAPVAPIQPAESAATPCLDPDCTHENHQ